MIQVESLCKTLGQQEVLKEVSACFERGKINLIIGQSGAGKTVLMKCLLGLMRPTAGQIRFDGADYRSMSRARRAKLRSEIGTVFQGSALFDSMTVAENVRFPLEMFTTQSKSEISDRVDQVLESVNLNGQHEKLPSALSGGMRKRVGIARAVVAYPKYLFCDEPNSGLDPKTASVIDNLIREITEAYHTTTVINTHDMNSVLGIGQKIIYLKDGVKEWAGYQRDLLSAQDKAVDDFVYGSHLMRKVRATLQRENRNNS